MVLVSTYPMGNHLYEIFVDGKLRADFLTKSQLEEELEKVFEEDSSVFHIEETDILSNPATDEYFCNVYLNREKLGESIPRSAAEEMIGGFS